MILTPKVPDGESLAFEIAGKYINGNAEVRQVPFPMTRDKETLQTAWKSAALETAGHLERVGSGCFLTLGDPSVYSTYTYLVRELRAIRPDIEHETVPGVTSFCAAAALASFPLGEGPEMLTVVPGMDNPAFLEQALTLHGKVAVMKLGKNLRKALEMLDSRGYLDRAVLVTRAGREGQVIRSNLREMLDAEETAGYMSILLVDAT